MSYAVIRTGGKQYRVQEGQTLQVEKLDADVGADVEFGEVLLLNDDGKVKLGNDELKGVTVKATVVRHGRGPKLHVQVFKRRKDYRRHLGHRQDFTEVRIAKLS